MWLAGVVAELKNAMGDLLDERLAPIKADLEDLKVRQAHVQRIAAIVNLSHSHFNVSVTYCRCITDLPAQDLMFSLRRFLH